jgi:hypothetical protein
MPEYKCECCEFKTIDKGKYLKHNETSKHLKKMESFVKVEVSENPLQAKVDMLEQTIQLLIKRIEALENKQDIKQDVSRVAEQVKPVVDKKIEPITVPVIEPVEEPVEEPVIELLDIDIVIGHIQEQCYINFDEYKTFQGDEKILDLESYVKENLDDKTQQKIANGEVVYPLLKDTYATNSEKVIFNKMCKLIPKESIKVNDISRGKFSLYCGEWLNAVESTTKLETLIEELQVYIGNLHTIYTTCKDMYINDHNQDNYIKTIDKVYQGDEVKSKVIKLLLAYYK